MSTRNRRTRRHAATVWQIVGLVVALAAIGTELGAVHGSPSLAPLALLLIGGAITCDLRAQRLETDRTRPPSTETASRGRRSMRACDCRTAVRCSGPSGWSGSSAARRRPAT